jgi:hypothetical protein
MTRFGVRSPLYARGVGFRDDSEALRAKVAKLEGDLAGAQATITRLEGRAPKSDEGATITRSRLLDAPSGIVLERVLPYAIGEEGYEAIAAAARAQLGVQVAQVGRSLHAGQALSITREGEHTRVRVAASWGVLGGGPIAAAGLSGTFAGMATFALMHDIAHASPAALLAGAVAGLLAVGTSFGWITRRGARAAAHKNVERYRGLFETVVSLAEEHASRGSDVRARVEIEPEEHEETPAEETTAAPTARRASDP